MSCLSQQLHAHADIALNRVDLLAPPAASVLGSAGPPACLGGQETQPQARAAGTHGQLLIRDLTSFPRFYESFYVYH